MSCFVILDRLSCIVPPRTEHWERLEFDWDSSVDCIPDGVGVFDLNLLSDRLYDLDSAIPDVIGLQPDAAVIKVISIPDNRCIRVVIPDDHVPNEFHEVLIHDMEVEEPLLWR